MEKKNLSGDMDEEPLFVKSVRRLSTVLQAGVPQAGENIYQVFGTEKTPDKGQSPLFDHKTRNVK